MPRHPSNAWRSCQLTEFDQHVLFLQLVWILLDHSHLKLGHTHKPTLIHAYVCVFVCFTTRAGHLEMVSDLSTTAFLACLRCFVSRRGLPRHVYSDNGSNFVVANNRLLKRLIPSLPVSRSVSLTGLHQRKLNGFSFSSILRAMGSCC